MSVLERLYTGDFTAGSGTGDVRKPIWAASETQCITIGIFAIIQIFPRSWGPAACWFYIPVKRTKNSLQMVRKTDSREVENGNLCPCIDPRSSQRPHTSAMDSPWLSITDLRLLSSCNVLLHGMSGKSTVCCTQWRHKMVHAAPESISYSVFKRTFADCWLGNFLLVRPCNYYCRHIRLVGGLVRERNYDHTEKHSKKRFGINNDTSSRGSLQA